MPDEVVKRLAEQPHPLGLRAKLQQALLGQDRQLDPRRDRVGVAVVEAVDLGLGARHAAHQVRERLACVVGGVGIAGSSPSDLEVHCLDLAGRILRRRRSARAPGTAPRPSRRCPCARRRSCSSTSVTRARASDPPRAPVVVAKDDAERLLGLEAVGDHALVALLEDVERHQLAGQQDDRQLEERQLVWDPRLPRLESVSASAELRRAAPASDRMHAHVR